LNLRPPGYEPGELPGCSTPRRGRQYTTVDVVFWAALGFLIAAIVVGTAFVAVRAWRAWQAFLSLALVGAAGAELLAARGDLAAAKADRLTRKLDELQAAVARLERSTARGRVLADAAGEVLTVVRSVLAFVPRT
jgi:hypothetical protein